MNKLSKLIMFNCKEVQSFLYDYMEGKISSISKFRFELHLKNCPKCDEYFSLYESTANSSEFFDQNPPPEELKKKTLSFLEDEGIL